MKSFEFRLVVCLPALHASPLSLRSSRLTRVQVAEAQELSKAARGRGSDVREQLQEQAQKIAGLERVVDE